MCLWIMSALCTVARSPFLIPSHPCMHVDEAECGWCV